MKAAVLHANEDLRYEEIEKPVISGNEVLIRVRYTGICGSDVPRVLHNGAHFYPIVLGHEFSGVVEETGKEVTKVKAGDRVSGIPLKPCMKCADCQKGDFALCKNYVFVGSRINGSFADYVKLPETNVIPFDGEVSFQKGALFEPATIALHGIKCAGFTGGKDVAVVGCGTIGIFTMQWAKIYGAKTVTVFDISDKRLSLAQRLGADFAVNTLKEKTDKKFDFVFETAGNPVTTKMCFDLAANKASVCCIGTPHGEVTFSGAEWELMNRKEFRLTGSWMSYSAPFPGDEWELTAHFFKTGQLRFDPEMICREFPMSEAAEAFDMFKTPGKVDGKIFLYNPE